MENARANMEGVTNYTDRTREERYHLNLYVDFKEYHWFGIKNHVEPLMRRLTLDKGILKYTKKGNHLVITIRFH
jgi:hypothetical protein